MIKLSKRLQAAAELVRHGAVVADVGTDHAYLPIYLCQTERAAGGVASDINQGPLDRARQHILSAGFSDRIETRLTDGLHGVEAFAPTDVMIFGMGGELIAKILSEAPWVRERRVNLILQPMSKPDTLRAWLNGEGFSVIDETLTKTDRYYQTIHACFTGEREDYTAEELLIGKKILWGNSPHLPGFIERTLEVLIPATDGKRRGGLDVEKDLLLIRSLEQRRNALREERK